MTAAHKTRTAGTGPAAPPDTLRTVCHTTFAWVIVFTAFHLYWYLGGTFGFGDASATVPQTKTVGDWVSAAVISVMFLAGAFVPFALHRSWGRTLPRWVLHCCTWTGAILLIMRGTAGVLDSVVRHTGLLENGLTGLSEEQISGDTDPTGYTEWSTTATDLYFVTGGLLFTIAALRHRRSPTTTTTRHRPPHRGPVRRLRRA
ncbi:DUF3995 domain-containing protein [Streptomyces iconiensis]|uniref:DUF3995 domain-containing protein n=1 Tax=Streptomyces iconiensis TaxID=1384038 RepID=A0ABT7A694_9ACTN|nr:DUF3995 domain-containing protein [Streptomyces iconiensis]MDJ1136855.1 DUF3995 domain-containing protein [Streptomyces iconiensis]